MLTLSFGSWAAVLLLGAVHGVNPAMGWLFAVALGIQEERRGAVLRTLGPLALGHACAIGVVLVLAASIGLVVSIEKLKWAVAIMLLVMGCAQLRRHYHPRAGMRIGARDLTIWSFLVASAHGAGLMALPFVMAKASSAGSGHIHSQAEHGTLLTAGVPQDQIVALVATGIHTLGYLAVTAGVALVVYEKLGLRLLKTAWININLLWALTLIATALLTPLI
jgi:hypothetical protein